MDGPAVDVSVRLPDREPVENLPWTTLSVDRLRSATPWRTFRWHRGQKHYSGSYWSATTYGPVIYESRLELARLLFADFDAHVHGIVAQPFLMKTVAGAKARSHIPDYLLITDQGLPYADTCVHGRRQQGSRGSPSCSCPSNERGSRTTFTGRCRSTRAPAPWPSLSWQGRPGAGRAEEPSA